MTEWPLTGELKVRFLPHGEGLKLPSYATPDSAGLDLYSAIDVILLPGDRRLVPTGLAVEIPKGMVGYAHAKSGRALVDGLSLSNGTGVIDSDYRGEVKVILWNSDPRMTVTIKRGEKISQLVVVPYVRCSVTVVSDLSPTVRDTGGFGSTGL
jgi:dUTP pyrophosphatase